MAEVSVTLKAGSGYADPWIIVKGHGYDGEDGPVSAAQEVSAVIEELRQLSAFSAIKLIAGEFASAPAAGVQAALAGLPGATEIPDGPMAHGTQPHERRDVASPRPEPPAQSTPVCTKCGAPTKPKSGTGRNGAYNGFACTADRSHFDHIK